MFVDQYRPKTFQEMIGREDITKKIQELMKKDGGLPHLLFHGPSGTGKTTISEIIGSEILGANKSGNFFAFNASTDRGIDMVRNSILDIAKRRPIFVPYKIIFMDEADAMTPDAQTALRRIIEQFSDITRFIFSCNYRHKLIQPLLSRCVEFEFSAFDIKMVASYLKAIGNKNNLNYEDKQYIEMARRSGGDLRKALNVLEGKTDAVASDVWDEMTYDKFSKMSQDARVTMVLSMDPEDCFNGIFEMIKKEKLWKFIPLVADCQAKMNYALQKYVFLVDLVLKI